MKTMTAKNLKNKTGEAMRAVARGEKVVVTLRGKPFALMTPATTQALEKASMRPFEEAWSDIENSLTKTKPHFKSAKEAMSWTRRRSLSS
ncbi:MAG: type II toxin-antitoxin system prevent-host-death family antitoxin [Thermodesulfovibrionales bacterium]